MVRATTAQVTFGRPEGMQVRYDQSGSGMFDSEPMIVPARQNFPQGGLYRVKLTNIPGREGVELYPTLELAFLQPANGCVLGTQFDSDSIQRRRLRPSCHWQLCHQSHLPTRSRIPRSSFGWYRHAG